MPERTDFLIDKLLQWRWWLLAAAGCCALISWPSAGQVRFDRSIENMFAPNDPLLPPFQQMKRRFGGSEFALLVYTDEQLLDEDGSGLARVRELSERLLAIDGVGGVLSLSQLDLALKSIEPANRLRTFFVRDRDKPLIVQRSNALASRFLQLFEGFTHGADGRTASITCMLKPHEKTTQSREETIRQMHDVARNMPGGLAAGQIVGEPVLVEEGFAMVEEDGRLLGIASTILLALTIVISFRSLRWVVAPILVVQLSLLLTRATLAWMDLRLSMVSSMLTAIITVVGVATTVHVIVRYRQFQAEGQSSRTALRMALAFLLVPIFWSCTTDAIGFASLLISHVGPVRDFGVMMALGSLYVIVAVLLIVPAIGLVGRNDDRPESAPDHPSTAESALGRRLHRLVQLGLARPRMILGGLLVLTLVACGGIWRLQVETNFTKNFKEQSPIVKTYEFVEQRLGGAGIWDVIVQAPRTLDREYCERILDFEQRLLALGTRDEDDFKPLSKAISLIDAIVAADEDRVLRVVPVEVRAFGMSKAIPGIVKGLRTAEPDADGNYYVRIMLRASERQSAEQKQRLIDSVRKLAAEEFGEQNPPQAEVTGIYVLLTNLIRSMISDQWRCFAAATLGIFLMMALAFRDPVYAFVALVPNALPIVVVLGLLGWLGLNINMGAAMIAAVSMGLSVDSSIHYVTSFQRARRGGSSVDEALFAVQQSVGRAVVFSTLALVVGFGVLCSSSFVPTVYFGSLAALSMLGGLLGNLLVMPMLLKLVSRTGSTHP